MQLGLFDAKNRLSELVAMAERGEEVVITRRGLPVAKLVPLAPGFDRAEAIAAMHRMAERRKALQPGFSLAEIKDAVAEGRE